MRGGLTTAAGRGLFWLPGRQFLLELSGAMRRLVETCIFSWPRLPPSRSRPCGLFGSPPAPLEADAAVEIPFLTPGSSPEGRLPVLFRLIGSAGEGRACFPRGWGGERHGFWRKCVTETLFPRFGWGLGASAPELRLARSRPDGCGEVPFVSVVNLQ